MPVEFGDLKIYTVEEIAKKLKVSTHTIYEYIRDGKLLAKRFGKKYQITQDNLEKYFEEPNVAEEIK